MLVCSTGLIGEQLDLDLLKVGCLPDATLAIATDGSDSDEAGLAAAEAIMTTDTRAKQATFASSDGWTVGGMAKGAGMLAPGLATMLVVITTDAVLTSAAAGRGPAVGDAGHLRPPRLRRLHVDQRHRRPPGFRCERRRTGGCRLLRRRADPGLPEPAEQLLADGAGRSYDIAIEVVNAASEDDAVEVGRAVSRSNLFKAAIFGNDPNWGRVLAAVGTTGAEFDPYGIDVAINGVQICSAGEPDQPRGLVYLTPRAVHVLIDLHAGTDTATILTNDLTHDYVHENSAYAS